jgi:hypothetical protein
MVKTYDGLKGHFDLGHPVYDYAALESLDEFKRLAEDATLIIAHDTTSDAHNVVFGTEILRAVSHHLIPPQKMAVLIFAVDYRTLHVEHLCAAVRMVKGFEEWNGGRAD